MTGAPAGGQGTTKTSATAHLGAPGRLGDLIAELEWRGILHATTPNLGFYVIAILLAIVAPQVAAFGYLVLAILLVLPTTGADLLAPIGRRRVRNGRKSGET